MIRPSSSNQQTQSRLMKVSNSVAQQCVICCQQCVVVKYLLWDCQHGGICVHCADQYVLKQIAKDQIPKCCISQKCQGEIIIGQKCLFDYLMVSTKEKLINFLKTKNDMNQFHRKMTNVMRDCQKPDCKGFIIKGKCKICSTTYCLDCHQFQHTINAPCIKNKDIYSNTKCPICGFQFYKDGGCPHLKCPNLNCKFQYCDVCKKKWNSSHHSCQNFKTLKKRFLGFFACFKSQEEH